MNDKRIALVTGANKGLGFETSRQLAAQGITVLMGARHTKRGEDAAENLTSFGLDVKFVLLDVTSSAHIRNVADYIEQTFGRLDILVNNAGTSHPDEDLFESSVEKIPIRAVRETFDVNFFGPVELTQALLPLIKKSAAGRIVNVASVLGSLTLHSDLINGLGNTKPFAYDASKTALNQFTVHLAAALRNTLIKVNSAHPGWVRTDMGGPNAPMSPAEGARTAVMLATLDTDGPTGSFMHLDEVLPW